MLISALNCDTQAKAPASSFNLAVLGTLTPLLTQFLGLCTVHLDQPSPLVERSS